MAPMIFTKAILSNKPIKIFNNGKMSRSFTYINDIVDIIFRLILKPAIPDYEFDRNKPNPSTSWSSHRIFNIGNETPIRITNFIELLEDELGIEAKKKYEDMQPGDVQHTSSDCSSLREWIGSIDYTSNKLGIKAFINWYKDFYNFWLFVQLKDF